jgi:hypothetical protein
VPELQLRCMRVWKDYGGNWCAEDRCGSTAFCSTWRDAMEAAYGHLAMGCDEP